VSIFNWLNSEPVVDPEITRLRGQVADLEDKIWAMECEKAATAASAVIQAHADLPADVVTGKCKRVKLPGEDTRPRSKRTKR
jgi:hypothetical protein